MLAIAAAQSLPRHYFVEDKCGHIITYLWLVSTTKPEIAQWGRGKK